MTLVIVPSWNLDQALDLIPKYVPSYNARKQLDQVQLDIE